MYVCMYVCMYTKLHFIKPVRDNLVTIVRQCPPAYVVLKGFTPLRLSFETDHMIFDYT